MFTNFDIIEFYPSISESLLRRVLSVTREYINISDEEINVIQHSRKSLLFRQNMAWMKKDGAGLFDVAMGCYDGAEVCELVGVFILNQLPERCRKRDIRLYRDDGLAVFRGMSGSTVEQIRKDITKCISKHGLCITIQANLKTVNFLDLTFDLDSGKSYPYHKPNDKPLYINRLSNHPPPIQKQLPAAISRRLADISNDAEVFRDAAPLYNNALKDSDFSDEVEYVN